MPHEIEEAAAPGRVCMQSLDQRSSQICCLGPEETRRAGGQGCGKAIAFWKGNLLLVLVQGIAVLSGRRSLQCWWSRWAVEGNVSTGKGSHIPP